MEQEGPRNGNQVVSLELVQSIAKSIDETKLIINNVSISKSNFLMLMFYLSELQPLVEDLGKEDQQLLNSLPVWTALSRVDNAVDGVHRLIKTCMRRSRIFLLYKAENLLNDIRFLAKRIAEGIALMPDTLPQGLRDSFDDLRSKLEKPAFYSDPLHLQTAKEIADGVAAHRVDEVFATPLLKRITEALAVPMPAAAELKLELQSDLEAREREPAGATLQELKDICEVLNPAAVPADVRRLGIEDDGCKRHGSLSVSSSFICPITGQVMRDPVMLVEAGFTYERDAILEWFSRGHRTCPDTGQELENLELVPNYNLREAIEEFSDRASRGDLTDAIDILRRREGGSISEADIQEAVETIKSLSDTNPKYRRLIASMDGIQPLVGILKQHKERIPKVCDKVLKLLIGIAVIGDEYRWLIVKAGIIPVIMRRLWKNDGEDLLAFQLLHEVSKLDEGVSGIIESEKSVVCIVHATSHHSSDIKSVADTVLSNLCRNRRELAIKVAGYQVFGPLVTMLSSEHSLEIRAGMARGVVDLQLNEEGYTSLVSAGAIPPLLDLLKGGDEGDETHAAAKALQHLSSVESCKVPICRAGAVPALVQFLSSDIQGIRLAALGTLANLATDRQGVMEIDKEGTVLHLVSMLKQDLDMLMHEYALKTLACMAKESKTVRSIVKQNDDGYLVTLLEVEDLTDASRVSVLHLLSHLAEDRENRECVLLSYETVALLICRVNRSASKPEEQESILAIISGLSKMPERAEMLLTPVVLETLVKFLDCGTSRTRECSAVALSSLLGSSRATTDDHLAVGRLGAIQSLRHLLEVGSVDAKCAAAVVVGILSRHTPNLTDQQRFRQKLAWFLGVKKCRPCKVHAGKCSVRKTMCLVESGAAALLLRLLKGEVHAAEKAIEALSTLVEDERNRAKGLSFLVKNNAIPLLIGAMGKNPDLTEKAVILVELIFRDRRFREEKYYQGTQAVLYRVIAIGHGNTRRVAAQCLEHVGTFPKGSTYTD